MMQRNFNNQNLKRGKKIRMRKAGRYLLLQEDPREDGGLLPVPPLFFLGKDYHG
jgi:hypothetical protein